MHTTFTIESDGHSFHFHCYGNGKYPVLFFHGAGQTGQTFARLMYAFPDCRFYSPDLPYHGNTVFNSSVWDVANLESLFIAFCQKTKIKQTGIAGFSIGGKIALKLVEKIPADMISALYLFAPDGIHINPYYGFATKSRIGRQLFNYFLSRPRLLLNAGLWLKKTGLLRAANYRLLEHTLQKESYIKAVRKIWPATADLIPDQAAILAKINSCAVPSYFFTGKHDTVISSRKVKAFYDKITIKASGFYELNTGHNFAHPKATRALVTCIQNNILPQCSLLTS